jgi:hypothetical protein
MTPDLYAIQYASTSADVMALLERCVAYVRNGPVMALLPEELQGLHVHDACDVGPWQSRLEQMQRRPAMLSASARFWVEELAEMFRMASRRLADLQAVASASGSAPTAQARPSVGAHRPTLH